jgi:hypothetical protein
LSDYLELHEVNYQDVHLFANKLQTLFMISCSSSHVGGAEAKCKKG